MVPLGLTGDPEPRSRPILRCALRYRAYHRNGFQDFQAPSGPIDCWSKVGTQRSWPLKEIHDIPEPLYFG